MEKHVSAYNNEQESWVSSFEGRGMVTNSKSMVEVPLRLTSGTIASDEQLKAIKTNIREAAFRKISDRNRSGVDTTSDWSEENIAGQTCGVPDDGAFALGEIDSVCGAKDSRNHPYQGHPVNVRDHQAFNDTISGQNGVEGGDDGSMEIEGH